MYKVSDEMKMRAVATMVKRIDPRIMPTTREHAAEKRKTKMFFYIEKRRKKPAQTPTSQGILMDVHARKREENTPLPESSCRGFLLWSRLGVFGGLGLSFSLTLAFAGVLVVIIIISFSYNF